MRIGPGRSAMKSACLVWRSSWCSGSPLLVGGRQGGVEGGGKQPDAVEEQPPQGRVGVFEVTGPLGENPGGDDLIQRTEPGQAGDLGVERGDQSLVHGVVELD